MADLRCYHQAQINQLRGSIEWMIWEEDNEVFFIGLFFSIMFLAGCNNGVNTEAPKVVNEEIENDEAITNETQFKQERELINLFYGEWTNREQQDISLNLQEKREFSSKLYIQNDGKELLYIYDYLNKKHESHWTK